jgi:hypothetical protein
MSPKAKGMQQTLTQDEASQRLCSEPGCGAPTPGAFTRADPATAPPSLRRFPKVAAHLMHLDAGEIATLQDVGDVTRLLLQEPLEAWAASNEADGPASQARCSQGKLRRCVHCMLLGLAQYRIPGKPPAVSFDPRFAHVRDARSSPSCSTRWMRATH